MDRLKKEFKKFSPLLLEAFEELKKTQGFAGLRLVEPLVSGGSGVVYAVEGGDRPMVLKVIDATVPSVSFSCEQKTARAQLEMRAMLLCRECPYIMPLLGHMEYVVSEAEKKGIFLMLLPELIPLEQYLDDHPLQVETVWKLAADLCRALEYMELQELLHRDINPNNIYVEETAEGPRFILGDLGIVRFGLDPNGGVKSSYGLTQIGTEGLGVGIPPELRKNQDPQGLYNRDIWQLGKTIWKLIFNDEDSSLCGEIPPELTHILQKATKEDPWERYLHASDMLAELQRQGAVAELAADPKAAIAAFAAGKSEEALAIAARCHRSGNAAGSRIYAFLLYCACCRRSQDPLEEFCRRGGDEILEDLWYDNQDYAARALYAIIMLNAGKDACHHAEEVKVAAEQGCVFAEHYYGGWLYNGKMRKAGIPRDKALAMTYISRAVEKRYLPAMAFLKKLLSRESDQFIVGKDEDFNEILALELEDQPENFEQLAMLEALTE